MFIVESSINWTIVEYQAISSNTGYVVNIDAATDWIVKSIQ